MEDQFDWTAPRASTSQVLDLVPGATDKWLSWAVQSGLVEVPKIGTGQLREWTGAQIMEVWLLKELAKFGMAIAAYPLARGHLYEGLMSWPAPHEVSLWIVPGDPPVVKAFREDAEDDDPQHGAQLGHRGAPDAAVLLRLSRMIRRAEKVLDGMTPIHRSRGRGRKKT